MLLSERPSTQEWQVGRLFVGDHGAVLRNVLKRVGVEAEQFVHSSVIREMTKDPNLTVNQLERLLPPLLADIRAGRPKVIVPMGDIPLAATLNRTGCQKARGRVYWKKEWNCWVVPTVSINDILGEWGAARTLEHDIRRAVQVARCGYVPKPFDYEVVTTLPRLEWLVRRLAETTVDYCMFDTETTGLSFVKDRILCISFSNREGLAFTVPLTGWMGRTYWTDEQMPKVIDLLRQFLEGPTPKGAQNSTFDVLMIRSNWKIDVANVVVDPMYMHHAYDENLPHGMKFLSQEYEGNGDYKKEIDQYLPERGKKKDFTLIPDEALHKYCSQDSDEEYRVAHAVTADAERDGVRHIHDRITLPLVKVLAEASWKGILVDTEWMRYLHTINTKRLAVLEKECWDSVGEVFDISSNKQKSHILYDKLKLPVMKLNESGKPSVDEGALQLLGKAHPVIPKLLEIAGVLHDLTNYLMGYKKSKGMLEYLDGENRIHPAWFPWEVTGRVAANDPQVQNIKRTDKKNPEVTNFRKLLHVPEGWCWISSDYCQHEMNVIAYVAPDLNLQKACRTSDVHRAIASMAHNIAPEDVDSEMRDAIKTVGFGTNYGRTAFSIAAQYGKPVKWAEELQQRYFAIFPGIKTHFGNVEQALLRDGEIITPFGRKRHLYGIHTIMLRRRQAERIGCLDDIKHYRKMQSGMIRQAVNMTVQSPAADIWALASIRIADRLRADGLHAYLSIGHHDAWNGPCPMDEMDRTVRIVGEELCRPIPEIPGLLPKVEFKVGKYWGDKSIWIGEFGGSAA
jgi:DNA polymerase-1